MKHHQITYHSVPHETFSAVEGLLKKHRGKLQDYLDQLLWWNKRINLVSRDVPRETVWEHIRHSLILTQFDAYQNSQLVVDAGTGGGLPGLPLSIISGDRKFILNDIISKKVLAVKQMVKQIGLKNVTIKDKSVAELRVDSPFLLVSKHAFKIGDLYHLTTRLPWTKMAFYKGIDFEQELENIDPPLSVSVYDLFKESSEDFYKDKAIIFVSRISHPGN